METKTIYMYLPDEAVDVWRPVQAEILGSGFYRIAGPVPDHEIWEFLPGSIVWGQIKRLYDGDTLVAVPWHFSILPELDGA